MRVTVCELPHEPVALAAAWSTLCDHTAARRSQLVLLPELAFIEPFWESDRFEESTWARITGTCEAWIGRLHELDADAVVGTRPATVDGHHFNEGFLWLRSQLFIPLRRKYFLPDEPGGWESHWFTRGDARFPAFDADSLRFGLNICTEIWALETYADYAAAGVAAVLCPRATSPRTTAKWRAAGVVAAVRSGAYCLSSNRGDGGESGGGTGWIISPDGDVLAQTSAQTPFVTREIDAAVAAAAQSTYPRYALAHAVESGGWNRSRRQRMFHPRKVSDA
jgi:N-carbamoylputrescine amidase